MATEHEPLREIALQKPSSQKRTAENASEPTCICGHPLSHPAVTPVLSYGFWAWFALLMGITGHPKEAAWRCRTCGAVLKRSRDPEVLKRLSS